MKRITPEILDALSQVVDHFIEDEQRDHESRETHGQHIFHPLNQLRAWLDESDGGSESRFVREVAARYIGPRRSRFGIRDPEDVARFCRSIVKDNSREHFIALYLSSSHEVVSYSVVSIGSANQTIVSPREVFQLAVLSGAVAIVLAHNHPSGSLEPSQEDHQVTQAMSDAGDLLNIKVLDHVLFTDDGFLSFKESNAMRVGRAA